MPRALVVDDEDLTLRYLATLLEAEGFTVRTAGSFEEATRELQDGRLDVVLIDLVLPDGKGLDLLRSLDSRTALEVVVITGHASVDSAVQALHLGASDYLTKPIDEQRLRAILHNILRLRGLQEQIGDLHEELRKLGKFGGLIGTSPQMQNVYTLIGKVAPTGATVLVSGESGCGKEVVARTIHQFSPRRKSQFLAVNCGAISPNLIESEIFGHEKGSFTGAAALHKGTFERATAGTLFLDEIADMPIELQVKLLRVLETGSLTRIGGEQPIAVDVRVIAATNRPPAEAVASGKLREDLFYRLNVFSIDLPPLRARADDIDLLSGHFLSELNRSEGTSKRFSKEAMALLRRHSWPGNVRELKNSVQRAFIMAADEILPHCLPIEIQGQVVNKPQERIQFEVGTPLVEVERRVVLATLERCGGNKKRTAETLGINLRTLYNRLKAYGAKGGAGVARADSRARGSSEPPAASGEEDGRGEQPADDERRS